MDGYILVVDDDDDFRSFVAEDLESLGYEVRQAENGQVALERLEEEMPALVLLDLRLGEGDGRRVLEHIRGDAGLANTPVFVISGAADSAAGFLYDGPERIDGFFEKPLNLPRLLDRIREYVRVVA